MNFKFSPIKTVTDLDFLSSDPNLAPFLGRLKCDLEKNNFFGCYKAIEDKSVACYALLTNGYSTWQHRCLVISHIWIREDLEQRVKLSILEGLKDYLFSFSRDNDYQRITYFLEPENNTFLYNWLKDNSINDMTDQEGWLLFELGLAELNNLANNNQELDDNFHILKVEDIKQYGESIRELIKEIAAFEGLLEQFETKTENLIGDFNKFYVSQIVLTKDTNKVVGYSVYFKSYDYQRGVGCYLEDLYIQEEYRKKGIGSFLWREIVRDVLVDFQAQYMQWSVLNWNEPAIEFYKKFSSVDLTTDHNLRFLRFTTDKIYST